MAQVASCSCYSLFTNIRMASLVPLFLSVSYQIGLPSLITVWKQHPFPSSLYTFSILLFFLAFLLLFSHSGMSDDLMNCSTQSCSPLFPKVCSNSCPLSQWCHPTISSSAIPFSSCLQSFPASGAFPVSWLFASGVQSIGASASVIPMNIQGWFPLELTGLISLLSKGLSRVFSSTTVERHQFFSTQPFLLSHPYVTTGRTIALNILTFVGKEMSLLF